MRKSIVIIAVLLCFLLISCTNTKDNDLNTTITAAESFIQVSEPVETHSTEQPSSTEPQGTESELDNYLQGFVDEMNSNSDITRYTYSIDELGVSINVYTDAFDYYYNNKDAFSDEQKDEIKEASLSYVTGDIAEAIVEMVHNNGGEDEDVFLALIGEDKVYCVSKNLHLMTDELNK